MNYQLQVDVLGRVRRDHTESEIVALLEAERVVHLSHPANKAIWSLRISHGYAPFLL